MTFNNVVIIIPTYNEEPTIEETLRQVLRVASSINEHHVNILVFDSGSTDRTASLVKTMQQTEPRIHLQTETHKSGLGSAYLQAMRHALYSMNADVVFEFDADLSHQPHYIAPMLEHLKMHDVVIGSRYVNGGDIPNDWAWYRKFLSVLGNYVARFCLTYRYKDFTSGFRATRKAALSRALPRRFLSNHYAYKIELLWTLHCNKAQIYEYPIVFVDRKNGQSKLPTNSILDSLRVLLMLRLRSWFKLFSAVVS